MAPVTDTDPRTGSAETPDDHLTWLASLPRKRMGAAMLFTDRLGRVLLLEPTYQKPWVLPGGIVEADESPRAGAIREVREELGLDVVPGPLIAVNWSPQRADGSGDSLTWMFDGGSLDESRIRLEDGEIRSWAWCTPAEVEQLAGARQSRSLVAATAARDRGATAYLEDGAVPD